MTNLIQKSMQRQVSCFGGVRRCFPALVVHGYADCGQGSGSVKTLIPAETKRYCSHSGGLFRSLKQLPCSASRLPHLRFPICFRGPQQKNQRQKNKSQMAIDKSCSLRWCSCFGFFVLWLLRPALQCGLKSAGDSRNRANLIR